MRTVNNPYLEEEGKMSFGGWARNQVHNPQDPAKEYSETIVVHDYSGVGMAARITAAVNILASYIPEESKRMNLFKFERVVINRTEHHITVKYIVI